MSPFADQSASAGSLSGVQRRAVQALLELAPVVDELGSRFADAGHEIALVGGPVRDILLGRGSKDLDFTTSAHPDVIERLLSGWADHVWDIGKAFGTIGSRKGEWVLEVTTYRSETYDPTSRKPEVSYGDSLEGDLARRDFLPMAAVLEKHMQGRAYVVGDDVTAADFILAYTLDMASVTPVHLLDEYPTLRAYLERMYARPRAPLRIVEAFRALRSGTVTSACSELGKSESRDLGVSRKPG